MKIKKLLGIAVSMIFLVISYSHSASFDYQWVEQWLGYNEASAVAVDDLWNRYMVWNFYWTSYFWSTTLTSSWSYDVFITKLSPTGEYLRATQWEGDQVSINWIKVDSEWNSYIEWNFEWTVNFWSISLIGSGANDIFVAKLSPTGEYLRAVKWWGNDYDGVWWIGIDNEWNIYIAGHFRWTANFWPTTLISNGGYDFFGLNGQK
jgi:hypothetical protein